MKKSKFYKYRKRIVQVVCILMIIWFAFLWLILSDYQKSIPYTVVSDITSSLKAKDYDDVIKSIDNLPKTLKEEKTFKKYIAENTNKKDTIYYVETKSDKKNQKAYDIKIGKVKVMHVVMEKAKHNSLFGLQQYNVKSCTMNALTSYTINNYTDGKILVDGTLIDEKYYISENNKSENRVGINYLYKTYKIDDLTYIDEISLENQDANIEFDHDKNIISICQKVDDTKQEEIKEFALKVLKPYLVFSTASNGSRTDILQYVYPNSTLYGSINSYSNTWGMTYSNDELNDLKIDHIIRYSDYEYSCHVSVTYVVYQSDDGAKKEYEFERTFYITSRNGDYQLVDMVIE